MFCKAIWLVFTLVFVGVYSYSKTRLSSSLSRTRVYENFNIDFKNPEIVSDKKIFSEKQLQEFTSSYSVDDRFDIFGFIQAFFKKDNSPVPAKTTVTAKSPAKVTVSAAVLEEKTAAFVTGKIDGKSYASILKTAFGDKLPLVLPEIIANLPPSKAKELKV